MYIYSQSTGYLWDRKGNRVYSQGYSGSKKEGGKNNPDKQHIPFIGPIPRGIWYITERYNSKNIGPAALKLVPSAPEIALGRSYFRIHGQSMSNWGDASKGCIILPRWIRDSIWESGDHTLFVIE